jgi:1-aminocyclopropane-1-carboxylate deaminase/D-cysteine desulfhydrase-like pyridoxal-dependent ACC family enzyme
LCSERAELWIKDDGVAHPKYGGNKLRKLEFLLADAVKKSARRLLVLGAAGSHQVLATTLFGRELGFETVAVVCPQVHSEHAERTLRTALALGVRAIPAASIAAMPAVAARVFRRKDYLIAPGGAGTLGTLGYLRAVRELVEQIRAGDVPEPDVIVVPVASGGTAGGLLAGVLREGLRSKVLGILVADPGTRMSRGLVLGQAWSAMRRDLGAAGPIRLATRLVIDDRWQGPGYSWPTALGTAAMRCAAAHGIGLEATYTAKAFAAALELLGVSGFAAAGERPPVGAPSASRFAFCTGRRSPLNRRRWTVLPALPPELDRLFIGSRDDGPPVRPSSRRFQPIRRPRYRIGARLGPCSGVVGGGSGCGCGGFEACPISLGDLKVAGPGSDSTPGGSGTSSASMRRELSVTAIFRVAVLTPVPVITPSTLADKKRR